jgi:5'-nucleotidase/UDP-sugar diphosphatase
MQRGALPCWYRSRVIRCAIVLLLAAALISGCVRRYLAPTPFLTVSTQPTRSATTQPNPPATLATASPTATAAAPAAEPASRHEIIILNTTDEHGALLPGVESDFLIGGAANSDATWLRQGHDPRAGDGNVLLLSSGDNWTGPAISTWFKGESAVEVMNAMGYRASVIGNHELDFGQEVLQARIAQADFPYLAANLYRDGTQELPDWVKPYTLLDINGVRVGVIGLALEETPQVTAAKNLEGLAFGAYEPALRRWVPVMRREGAQIIVVQAHICTEGLMALSARVRDLGITLFHGGHCHESATMQQGNVFIGVGSSHWRDYVATRLVYDTAQNRVVEGELRLVDVLWPKSAAGKIQPRPEVQTLISKWQERVQVVLGETIGYTETGLALGSASLHNLLVDSWLWAYPQADVAISNVGGFRQGISRGDITLGDIVSAWPFDNELLDLTVKGRDIRSTLDTISDSIVVAGVQRDDAGRLVLTRSGEVLQPDAAYRLLTTDYMYGNTKYPFRLYDSSPYETSIPWRQPVIDWISAQHSDKTRPIETIIDDKPHGIE